MGFDRWLRFYPKCSFFLFRRVSKIGCPVGETLIKRRETGNAQDATPLVLRPHMCSFFCKRQADAVDAADQRWP